MLQNAEKNNSLQHAAIVQQRADENVLKLAEEQKVGSCFKFCMKVSACKFQLI